MNPIIPTLLAATLLTPAAIERGGMKFERCLPRPLALMHHAQNGFVADGASKEVEGVVLEKWRNPKNGQRFGTIYEPESGQTCFVGPLEPTQEV